MKRSTHLLAIAVVGALTLNLMAPAAGTAPQAPDPLAIISPAVNGAQLTAPVEVKVRLAGASALGLRALLNGADVTHLFGPPAGGVVRAILSAGHLKHGVNRLEARLGEHRAWRTFRVKSLRATEPGPAPVPSPTPPLLVPIQTRIISGDGFKAPDYAIKVGDTLYAAPDLDTGSPEGYQVLLLDRATLELVSNQSFYTAFPNDVQQMANTITNPSFTNRCGDNGCLLVVQSLIVPGYTPCWGASGKCSGGLPGSLFENLGGSAQINYASGYNQNTSYSLITNFGPGSAVGAGGGFERLTCNYANNCGDMTNAGGRGAISGVLIKDNNQAYTFAYPGRATFSTGTGASPTGNTITIGGTPNGGSYASAPVSPTGGAFQVLVIYGDSLQLVSNDTFDFDHLYSDDPSVRTMAQVLWWAAGDENSLVFISSVGTNMWHNNWLLQWSKVAQAVAAVGGTYSVFMSLGPGDDYSLVGRGSPYVNINTGLSPFIGNEASTVVSRATGPAGPPPASNQRGVLALDNRGYYRPVISNLTSTFDQSTVALIDAVALQPPTPWPYPQSGNLGQQKAYEYISQQIDGGNDIRANYRNVNYKYTFSKSLATGVCNPFINVTGGCYQPNPGFSEDDFTSVQAQLGQEFTYVGFIQAFFDNITTLYTEKITVDGGTLTAAYNAVKGSLSPNDGSKLSPKWQTVLAGAQTIAIDLGAVAGGPPAKLALDTALVASNVAMAFANDSNGTPLQNVETTFEGLQQKQITDFEAGLANIGNLFDLIFTDWGRLQTLGPPLVHGCDTDNPEPDGICWDPSLNGAVLAGLDRALRREYITQLMASAYEMGLWTNVSEGHGLPKLNTLCSRTQYSVCISDGEGNVVCDCICDTTSSDAENWLALPSGPTAKPPGPDYDGQYYDIYMVGSDVRCSSNNNHGLLHPLFSPLSPDDPTQLGVYKPYYFLYLRGSIHLRRNEKCTRGTGGC